MIRYERRLASSRLLAPVPRGRDAVGGALYATDRQSTGRAAEGRPGVRTVHVQSRREVVRSRRRLLVTT